MGRDEPRIPFCYDCHVGINTGGLMPGLGTIINIAL